MLRSLAASLTFAPARRVGGCGLGPTAPAEAGPAPSMPFVKEIAVVPAAAPVPLFKYRLLPLSSDLNPGDAAPTLPADPL